MKMTKQRPLIKTDFLFVLVSHVEGKLVAMKKYTRIWPQLIAVCFLVSLLGGCAPSGQSQEEREKETKKLWHGASMQEKLLKYHYRSIAKNMSIDLRELENQLHAADEQQAKKMLEKLPDAEFVVFALHGDMDGSVFSHFIGTKPFEERILALNDDDFANLMILRKGWHSGTALMAIVNRGVYSDASGKTDPDLIRRFWTRIKKLTRYKMAAILNADYFGATLWDWLEDNPEFKKGLPQDIKDEMLALLKIGLLPYPYEPLEKKLSYDKPAAKKMLDQMSDEEFLPFAGRSGMDRSTFADQVGTKEFRDRVFALSDDNFTELMTKLKIWHGGTPLMLLIHNAQSAVFQGEEPYLLREFWDRIKKLPKDQVLQILNANYLGHKFPAWIKEEQNRRDVPSDILQEMDALLEKTT